MALTIAGHVEHTPVALATSRTVTLPAGIQDGDTIVVHTVKGGSSNTPVITGLTGLSKFNEYTFTGHSSQIWVKQNASASDSSTVLTVTTAVAYRVAVIAVVLRGDLAVGGGVFGSYSVAGIYSSSPSVPTVTAGQDSYALWFMGGGVTDNPSMVFTPPAGVTEIAHVSDAGSTAPASSFVGYTAAAVDDGDVVPVHPFTYSGAGGINWSGWTLLLKREVSASVVRPVSVTSNAGGFVVDGAADIVTALSDSLDTTSDLSPVGATNAEITVRVGLLANTGNPTISYRAQAIGGSSATVVLSVRQGSTEIATWTDSINSTLQTYSHTLTTGQTANITDWGAIDVRRVVTVA